MHQRSTHTRVLNWQPAPEKHAKLALHPLALGNAPAADDEIDLEPSSVPIYDQAQLGSCTAFMGTGAIQHKMKQEGNDPGELSEMLQYQLELMHAGQFGQDVGSNIATAFLVACQVGLVPEASWDYNPARFMVRPPQSVMDEAAKMRLQSQMAVRVPQNVDYMKAILSGGSLIGFGFQVPKSFMGEDVATSGIWTPQQGAQEPIEGGHALCIAGYSKSRGAFKWRNSWSAQWGLNGYVWVPEWFVMSAACSEFTAIIDAPH